MSMHYSAYGARNRERLRAYDRQRLAYDRQRLAEDRARIQFLARVPISILNPAEVDFLHGFCGQITEQNQLLWFNTERRAFCDALQSHVQSIQPAPLPEKPHRD